MIGKRFLLFSVLVVAGLVAGCGGIRGVVDEADVMTTEDRRLQSNTGVFGDTFGILGGGKKKAEAAGGIGVNAFLWRATLDTVRFMPITNADPFGGVVITDWHTPDMAARNERFKLNVFILGRTLRADGVRVAVFRQALDASGGWRDAPVDAEAAIGIEDAILTKARQLRNETFQQQ